MFCITLPSSLTVKPPTTREPLYLCKQANNSLLCTDWAYFKQEACFATFFQDRVNWPLVLQHLSSTTSETEWLRVDIDRYKIINVYKLPSTRVQISDIPVFPQPCLYAGNFNCPILVGFIFQRCRRQLSGLLGRNH